MELRRDAPVVTASGEQVGYVDCVVLNPKTKEITAIVVRKGLLFPHDKIVPINMVDEADDDGVKLRDSAGDMQDLQEYQSTYYVPADEADSQGGAETSASADAGRSSLPHQCMPTRHSACRGAVPMVQA